MDHKSPKNIVIIMSDEQRTDTLGCYGNKNARTQNIDKLAQSGTVFTRCYTPYPLCCPARASLFSCVLPHKHHVVGNWRHIAGEYAYGNVMSHFRRAGYHTSYTGKWHIPGTDPGKMGFSFSTAIPAVIKGRDRGRYISEYRDYVEKLGYELLPNNIENLTATDFGLLNQEDKAPCGRSAIPLEHYLETWQTEKFIATLESRPVGKPFLAVCSYNAPHFPMIVPAPYDTIVSPREVFLPDNFMTGTENKPAEVIDSKFMRDARRFNEDEWKRLIAHYWGFCALIDTQVGKIIQYLENQGLMENTIIVYTSDHGDMMGSHGLNKKGFPMHYEEDLHVPLIIYNPLDDAGRDGTDRLGGPGGPGGVREHRSHSRYTGFISLMDIFPTLAACVGLGDRFPVGDGESYADIWTEKPLPTVRNYVIAESFKIDGKESGCGDKFDLGNFNPDQDSVNLSIKTHEHTYIFHWDDEDELYDQSDIGENYNIASGPENREIICKLREILLATIENDDRSGFARIVRNNMKGKETRCHV